MTRRLINEKHRVDPASGNAAGRVTHKRRAGLPTTQDRSCNPSGMTNTAPVTSWQQPKPDIGGPQ
jgi:hypothetical protein